MDEKELQEKIAAYRILESRIEGLAKQRENIANKLIEVQNTLNSLEEVEKSEEVLFPVGAEAYVHGKITEKNKMIVEIGAGIAMEKTLEEAKQVLNERKENITKILENIQKDMVSISSRMEDLGTEIQESSGEESGEEGEVNTDTEVG